jgi:hypothetical protein
MSPRLLLLLRVLFRERGRVLKRLRGPLKSRCEDGLEYTPYFACWSGLHGHHPRNASVGIRHRPHSPNQYPRPPAL